MSIVRKIFSVLTPIIILSAAVFVMVNRQQIIDEITLWQYKPSAEIVAIADRVKMSDTGRKMFYVSNPQIKSANEFNEDCRRVEKGNAILGCYNPSSRDIYIYNVTNTELDGVKEVTAAHEMLHAAWERLSESEKSHLSELLEKAYDRVKNKKLSERMEYYDRAQPGTRANELHSILGTEFADLGDELEEYYRRYFTDRSEVVKLHMQYQEKFESRENEAQKLSESLKVRKEKLNRELSQYSTDLTNFNNRVADFNRRAGMSGGFLSQSDFYSQRQALKVELSKLNERRVNLNSEINSYNSDVLRLRELGVQIDELNKSLNSLEGAK